MVNYDTLYEIYSNNSFTLVIIISFFIIWVHIILSSSKYLFFATMHFCQRNVIVGSNNRSIDNLHIIEMFTLHTIFSFCKHKKRSHKVKTGNQGESRITVMLGRRINSCKMSVVYNGSLFQCKIQLRPQLQPHTPYITP